MAWIVASDLTSWQFRDDSRKPTVGESTILKNDNNLSLTPAKQLTVRGWDGSPYVVTVLGGKDRGKTNKTNEVCKKDQD